MTPSKWLRWHSTGAYHVHSDEEAAADTWRPGAACEFCPHVEVPWAPPRPAREERTPPPLRKVKR